ncbi:histidine kinase [Jiulongibacter sediminis]|uniref:histidine kinase n=1 Tax=Jiulongibacter sediminis TaxID=1605367 RepID=UPI0026F2C87F|nr:histidine kinase [Jiulongibacter sediminis]
MQFGSKLLILLLISCGLSATEVPALHVHDGGLSSFYDHLFTSDHLPEAQWKGEQKFSLYYSGVKAGSALLFIGDAQYIEVVHNQKDTLYGGAFQSDQKIKNRTARYLLPVQLFEGHNTFQIRAFNRTDEAYFLKPVLFANSSLEEARPLILTQNERARNIHYAVFCVLCIILVYAIFQFVLLHKKSFSIYALYVASIIVFLLFFADDFFQTHLLTGGNPQPYSGLNLIPQGLIYVLYAEFGLGFLEVKEKDKLLFKVSRVFQVLTMCIVTVNAFYHVNSTEKTFFNQYIYILYFLPLLLSTFMALQIIIRFKDPIKWFIILGSVFITAGTFIEILGVYVFERLKPRSFYFIPSSGIMDFNYTEIGYVLESLIFLLGIAYKNSRTERNVQWLNEQTIMQLREKEQLEKQVNDLLNEKLKISEDKLAGEKLQNENERNKTKLMQAQLKSLQLQMNPHYLFNSLNSINDFIISKKPRQASEYLALYARMMRNTLRNSDQAFNTLEQELQYCEDYLKLEALRFEGKFDFEIVRPKNLDLLDYKLPGMMLQPILENAVWHGIMNIDYKGFIKLDASQSHAERLCIEIKDNGTGLSKEQAGKGSYGLRNIRDKVQLINQLYGKELSFTIENRKEKSGVVVRFEIPVFEV